MKLAAAYDNGNGRICKKLENAKVLKVYEIEDGEIINTEMVGTMADGVEDIISLIMLLEADCVLCDEIARKTMDLLNDEGILFYSGFDDDADEAVDSFINGYVVFGPDE